MKISHNTNDLLILGHIPWALSIGLSCVALLFVGLGFIPFSGGQSALSWVVFGMFSIVGGGLWIVMLGLFAKRLQFIFDRQTDRIVLRRRSIFGHQESTHKLSRLAEARIETDFSESGQTLFRPVLILQSHEPEERTETPVPLHSYFTTGPGPEAMVEVINQWLARK